jgi:hypothetical protein
MYNLTEYGVQLGIAEDIYFNPRTKRSYLAVRSSNLPPGISINIGDEIVVLGERLITHNGLIMRTSIKDYDLEIVIKGWKVSEFKTDWPVILVNKMRLLADKQKYRNITDDWEVSSNI